MAASYSELFAFLDRLGGKLDELTEIQKEKTNAVRRDDLLGVDACMKKEQVVSLSLRSMEQQRVRLLRELGLAEVPLSGLAEHCPAEQRQDARAAVERLRNRYAIYQSAANVSRNTLEINLHQIEKIIAEQEQSAPPAEGRMADIRA